MIDDREIRSLARQLGVPEIQIRRDHLLSHLIDALPLEDRVVFIGGTALNRTHLPDVRLSEDLDVHLIAGKADDLVDELIQGVRLEFPGASIISRTRQYDVATNVLEVDGIRIQIQAISNRPRWIGLPTATIQLSTLRQSPSDTTSLHRPPTKLFFGYTKPRSSLSRHSHDERRDVLAGCSPPRS